MREAMARRGTVGGGQKSERLEQRSVVVGELNPERNVVMTK